MIEVVLIMPLFLFTSSLYLLKAKIINKRVNINKKIKHFHYQYHALNYINENINEKRKYR